MDLNTIEDSDLVKEELIDSRSKEITHKDVQTQFNPISVYIDNGSLSANCTQGNIILDSIPHYT